MSNYLHTTNMAWQSINVEGIFSKELIGHPEGTAKLVLLKPGAEYPRHQHPQRTEYAYVVQGVATLSVADQDYESRPGDFVQMPTDTLHALANHSSDDVILFVGAIYHQ